MFELLHAVGAELPPNRDYITTGGLILVALVTTVGTVLAALIQSNRKLTRRSVDAAEVAAERAEPTGNGFAEQVTTALERIEATQIEHGRDIGGIRQDMRAERIERMALGRVVDRLIEKEE